MTGQDQPRIGASPSPLVVEIGLKEIYDLLVATNTNVQLLAGDIKDLSRQGDDHEARIRALERGRWPLPAVSALIALSSLALAAVALFNH